ncbi:phage virion morphogenesis protein [Arcicella sp. LKC2W]|uniref:phage virion morphogenesis protein n=1 Tax=Arcicella sp. LKC2W TaxID=2984198 RepID=UPI002B214A6E|nr:phage virion morphogenesis protein [Arcicella sp. LKC2W]MEA5461566.1 phage virion morphogenesis protein [Arcicella sp. LKC2W]
MNLAEALRKHHKVVTNYIKNDAPDVIGKYAVSHAQKSFEDEGYTDSQLEPWKEVKRRNIKGDSRNQTRPILSDTGYLKKSIRYQKTGQLIQIGTDAVYAKIHNEGGTITLPARSETFKRERHTSGKKKGKFSGGTTSGQGFTFKESKITIPQRQFIGKSKQLEQQIKDKIIKDLKRITKK